MASDLTPSRILVVDDDPKVLHAVLRVLERDYEVEGAAHPHEALAWAAANRPDLALLDVRMPQHALGKLFAGLVPPDLFMTAVYLLLENDGKVSWAAAGQDPPLRMDRAGQITAVDFAVTGLPLGIDPDQEYATVEWHLAVGERLFLFTDGICEARDRAGRMFGRQRLQNTLKGTCPASGGADDSGSRRAREGLHGGVGF